nr:ABC transporter transmembrane domain-containing protein [Ktedonobacteraceae bacterium]
MKSWRVKMMASWQENMMLMQMVGGMSTNLISFLFRNLKGYRFWIGIAFLLTIVQVGSDILIAFPFKFILDKIVSHKDPALPGGILDFFDRWGATTGLGRGEGHSLIGVILLAVSLLVVLNFVSAVATYAQNSVASIVGKNLTEWLRKELFAQIQRLTLDWHNKQKKGEIIQRLIGDIAALERLVTDGLIEVITGILTLIGCIVILLFISVPFTLLFIVVLPALILIAYSYAKSTRIAVKKAVMSEGEVANVATEDVNAITLIKAFGLEERESARFSRYVSQNRMATVRAGELQAQLSPVLTILVALATAIIIGVGAYVAAGNAFAFWFFSIPAGALTIGSLTIFLSYLGKLYLPLRAVSRLTSLAVNALTGAERIQEVFDQAPELLEMRTPYTGPTKLKGEIRFEQVVFGYTPDTPILKGIDLSIPAGRKIGVVGLSGGGKSTLIKLIPRFYDVQQGALFIDNIDTRQMPLKVLRQNISLVLQESILFEGTIRENIALGRPGASDEEIIEAAMKASIHDTIMRLPDGYNTRVRESGSNFSGGQRQRLAIARAILRDAPILILDEPTASLDVEAEVQVTRALDQLIVNRTVLLISHRLSTLGNVDEIIVLKDGNIVERGTFQELKMLGGVFAGFLEEQDRYNRERKNSQSVVRQGEIAWTGDSEATPRPRNGLPQPVSTPDARIEIEVDGKIVEERVLNGKKAVLTIGRLPSNDVIVPSHTVSRMHARLHWKDGMWIIEDTESLNGLMYRGNRVDQLALMNGDRVHLAPGAAIQFTDGM